MNIYFKYVAGITFVSMIGLTAPAFAASNVILTNGKFTPGTDTTTFGYAICNGGSAVFSGTVPVLISTNGVSQTISFSGPIAAGACATAYLPYATFNMTPNNNYTVQISIDPTFSVISNTNDRITYGSITVPANAASGQVLGASTMSDTERNFLLNELASAAAILNSLLAKITGK